MTEAQGAAHWIAWPFWNRHERRLRALWRLVSFGLVGTILARLVALTGLTGRPVTEHPVAGSVSGLVLSLATLWVCARLLERRPLADYGLALGGPAARELLLGLVLGALLMAGIFFAELALGWVTVTGTFRSGDPGISFAAAFLKPLVVFFCVGIYEEAVTRGFLVRTLGEGLRSRWIPPRTALVLATLTSAALFGLGHRNNPNATLVSTLDIAVAGLFLALPYLLTTRLAFSIGLHMTWNLFQGNVFGFPVSGMTTLQTTVVAIEQRGPALWTGGGFGPEAGLIGLVAMAVGSVIAFVMLRDADGRAEIQETLAAPPSRPAPPPAAPPAEPEQLTA